MILGDIDALIGLSETELSAEELLSVAGGIQEESDIPPQLDGICMIEGCAAKACAADAPCYVNS